MHEAKNWLLHDHRHYEEVLVDCKHLALQGDWQGTEQRFHDLVALLKGHFLMEELVLFPAYEGLVAVPRAPTEHLCNEHNRVRQHLKALAQGVRARETQRFIESWSRLDQLMAVHHEKEEELFLPMAGHALLDKKEEVMARIKRFDWRAAMQPWQGLHSFPPSLTDR